MKAQACFDFVAPRKERSVAAHRIEQQTFVGFRARLPKDVP